MHTGNMKACTILKLLCSAMWAVFAAVFHTVRSHLSGHIGNGGCSDNETFRQVKQHTCYKADYCHEVQIRDFLMMLTYVSYILDVSTFVCVIHLWSPPFIWRM